MPGETDTDTITLSEESQKLAALGRGDADAGAAAAEAAAAAAADSTNEKPQRPDYIPEKFWDAETGTARYEDLAKSYTELEKLRGAPKGDDDPAAKAAAEEAEKATKEAADAVGIPADLFSSAQAEYAESGDLSAESRSKIIAAGIDEGTLDTYLAGVKALSDQLTRSVYETAGGEDAYKAATEWARENWTDGQIAKFDAALNDPDMRDPLIRGLMADFTAAGGTAGEGNLTLPGNGSIDGGDLYHYTEEFIKDLSEADAANDTVARRKAVAKLERSKKAKTIDSITPRSPYRLS